MFFLFTKQAKGQFGSNPPSVKWQQINTPSARIIFPKGIDTTAFQVANIINRINPVVKPTLGKRQKLVNIVLQNQTLVSNGYVGLAPFRSEFYLTPEQNSFELGSLPFAGQLAMHEFRHVQQYNNFDVGLTRALHLVFGEGGQALGSALSVPDWLFEGDAVYNETLVSRQGRGRLPYFFNDFRSLWAAGKDYSYMKLRNGSYRDVVPNHYPLGYMLVAYGREQYGSNFWGRVGQDAASFESPFFPLQHTVKKYSGQTFKQFTALGINYFKEQLVSPAQQSANAALNKKHFEANLEYPVFADAHTLIYKKSTYRSRPVFVINYDGKERTIRVSDVVLDDYFSYAHGRLLYTSYRPDLRWGNRDYNELIEIDVATGKQRRITRKTKYFAPSYSLGGDTIVAVKIGPSGKSYLHLLNGETGRLLKEIPNATQVIYTYPKFYNATQVVSAVRKPTGEMMLALIDINTGSIEELTTPAFTPVAFPVVKRDTVYFTATAGNNDRLYALTINDKHLYQLSNDSLEASLGNYQPAVSAQDIAWVSPSVAGYQLHSLKQSDIKWKKVNSVQPLTDFGITNLSNDPAAHIADDTSFTKALPEKKYPKFTHPFNFHSLIPYFDDPDYTVSLQGQNILNTFVTNLDFTYNRNEQYKKISFSAAYGAWFPYVFGSAGYTFDRRGFSTRLNQNIYWNEKSIQGGVIIPLTLSKGQFVTGLNLESSLVYSALDVDSRYQALFRYGSYTYSDNTISFSNRVQQARQNIYPHWAQNITVNYRGTISSINARQFMASGNFYFPGLSANHSFVINAAWQGRDHANNIYTNNFPFSRGYTAANLYEMSKVGVNYHLPLLYPDAGFANLIYLLRVRANLFFDATRGSYENNRNQFVKANFRTAGAELYFDTKWFNQASVSFGLRYSYLLDEDLFGGYDHHRISLIVPLTSF
ncbi:hypothetical protein GCM10027037_07030 [Mucilaginibacter koreensis]